MGRAYYYFAATLPLLMREGRPPFTLDSFLEQCQSFLTKSDAALVYELLIEGSSSKESLKNSVFYSWYMFNQELRNEIARFRAERLSIDPKIHTRGEPEWNASLRRLIETAAKEENVLKAEQMIAGVRWDFLDDLEKGHFFDLEYLMIYGLKIKILSRQEACLSPKGKNILEHYKSIEVSEI